MAIYFLDSSALVKRYVEEQGTGRVLELLASPHRIAVSRLAMVEVTSAVTRRAHGFEVSPDQVAPIFDALDFEFRERFEVEELGKSVLSRAAELARTRALRTLDAIQLACALSSREGTPNASEFVFVCADTLLNAAARAENLSVMNPCGEG